MQTGGCFPPPEKERSKMDYLQDPTPEQECADACKDPAIIKAFMNHLPDPDKISWGVVEIGEWGSGEFKSPLEILTENPTSTSSKAPLLLLTGEDAQRFYRRATGDNWGRKRGLSMTDNKIFIVTIKEPGKEVLGAFCETEQEAKRLAVCTQELYPQAKIDIGRALKITSHSKPAPEEHTRRQLEILGEAFTLLEDYQAYQAGYAQTIAGMLGHRVLYNLTDIDSCATMCMSIAREAESAAAAFQRLINEYRAIVRKEN